MGLVIRNLLIGCLAAAIIPLDAAVIVQLRVVEGEGSVYGIASRATRGLTVQVTDETGKPVEGAAVSFRLPDEGPSGVFSSGLRTEVVSTKADGRATVWGMLWNKVPGAFEIRITAVKDQARAGIVSTQYLSDAVAAKAGSGGPFQPSHHSLGKWLLIAAVAAGAGAGLAVSRSQGTKAAAASSVPSTQIGNPSITIGPHP